MSETPQTKEQEPVKEGELTGMAAHRLLTFTELGRGGVGPWYELHQAAKLCEMPEPSLWLVGAAELSWKVEGDGNMSLNFSERQIDEASETHNISLRYTVNTRGQVESVEDLSEGTESSDPVFLKNKIAEKRKLTADLVNQPVDSKEVSAILSNKIPDPEVMKKLRNKLVKDGGKVKRIPWIKDQLKRAGKELKHQLWG